MTDTTAQRRARDQADRRSRIIASARTLAESAGWEAVTTRRLADAIEYSQPVLYAHFPAGKPEIVSAVALQGFTEMAAAMVPARQSTSVGRRIETLAHAYLDFARANPAVYEAMFALPIGASFGTDNSELELRNGFERFTTALGPDQDDMETAAEVLWSSLHGLATLERAGRLRPAARADRIAELVKRWSR